MSARRHIGIKSTLPAFPSSLPQRKGEGYCSESLNECGSDPHPAHRPGTPRLLRDPSGYPSCKLSPADRHFADSRSRTALRQGRGLTCSCTTSPNVAPKFPSKHSNPSTIPRNQSRSNEKMTRRGSQRVSGGRADHPHAFENGSDLRGRRNANGSICVRDGEPRKTAN